MTEQARKELIENILSKVEQLGDKELEALDNLLNSMVKKAQ